MQDMTEGNMAVRLFRMTRRAQAAHDETRLGVFVDNPLDDALDGFRVAVGVGGVE